MLLKKRRRGFFSGNVSRKGYSLKITTFSSDPEPRLFLLVLDDVPNDPGPTELRGVVEEVEDHGLYSYRNVHRQDETSDLLPTYLEPSVQKPMSRLQLLWLLGQS